MKVCHLCKVCANDTAKSVCSYLCRQRDGCTRGEPCRQKASFLCSLCHMSPWCQSNQLHLVPVPGTQNSKQPVFYIYFGTLC